jgi:NAD(P)-dependent dehydrogenase (short-subunit alcohol dehydrogenase family)
VAVATGAADGLGHAIALGLAGAGARVVGADVDDARLAQAMARVGTRGVETRAVHCDVGSAEDVDRLFERVDRDFGRVPFSTAPAGGGFEAHIPFRRKDPLLYPLPRGGGWGWAFPREGAVI